MQQEMITANNISNEFLKKILDSAYIRNEIHSNGEIKIVEGIKAFARISESQKSIKLIVGYGFKEDATLEEKMKFVNKINDEYIMIKAYVIGSESGSRFEYDMFYEGGLTKAAFVLVLRRFVRIVPHAVKEYGDGIIAPRKTLTTPPSVG